MATVEIATEDVVRKIADATSRRDLTAIAALLAPDITVYSPRHPDGLRGRDTNMKDIESNLFKTFPDVELRISKIIAKGDSAALKAVLSGTNKGPLELPTGTGTIPATNKRVEFPAAVFFRFNTRGQITEMDSFWDTAAVLKQLGITPGSGT